MSIPWRVMKKNKLSNEMRAVMWWLAVILPFAEPSMIVNGVFSACSSGIIITNNSSPLMSLVCWCFLFLLSVVRDDQHILSYFSFFVCPWSRAYISRYNWICWFDTVNTILLLFCLFFIINWLMTSHWWAAPGNQRQLTIACW